MIDFACRKFDLEEIIKCGLGLTRAELVIIKYFIKHSRQEFTSNEISKELGMNITTIQRAVKKLSEKKIVVRHQKNMDKGGYVYTYESVPKKEIREILKKIVNNWRGKVNNEIDLW